VARMGETTNAYRILVPKLENPSHNWEDNIKRDLKRHGKASTGLISPKTATSGGVF
jgi:hypothetical protein